MNETVIIDSNEYTRSLIHDVIKLNQTEISFNFYSFYQPPLFNEQFQGISIAYSFINESFLFMETDFKPSIYV